MIKLLDILQEILLTENKIIDDFERALMIYIENAYQRIDDNQAELVELTDVYDYLEYILKNTSEEDFEEGEKEYIKTFIKNKPQIDHYLIDNTDESIKVQWPMLKDVFYYTPLVRKNQIWLKLGTTPNSKLDPKYDYYNPSEDLDFPIKIKNKEDFEKYAKKLEVNGYYWFGGKSPLSFNPVEQMKGMAYPFKIVKAFVQPDGTLDKNSKMLAYSL